MYLFCLPNSLLVLLSNLESSISISLLSQMENVPIPLSAKLTCGPMNMTASYRVVVISSLNNVVHFLSWRNPSRGVFPETPCCLRFLALKLMDTAAHAYRCPVVPFPMKFTFNPLFWLVNRSLKKLETVQVH